MLEVGQACETFFLKKNNVSGLNAALSHLKIFNSHIDMSKNTLYQLFNIAVLTILDIKLSNGISALVYTSPVPSGFSVPSKSSVSNIIVDSAGFFHLKLRVMITFVE